MPFKRGVIPNMGDVSSATRVQLARLGGSRPARRSKKRRATRSARSPRRRKAGKPARLVKGSAAAKRHMAKIRRKRKR